MENNEKFKLITRRWLAWVAVFLALGVFSAVVLYQMIGECGCRELAAAALACLIETTGLILGFYFAKKTSEE